MGYYTKFKLTVVPEEDYYDIRHEFIDYFGPIDEEDIYDEMDEGLGGGEDTKWYQWEADITDAAKKHPNTLIILDGEGEDQGDVWRAFARGDKFELHVAPKWTPPHKPLFDYDEGDCC